MWYVRVTCNFHHPQLISYMSISLVGTDVDHKQRNSGVHNGDRNWRKKKDLSSVRKNIAEEDKLAIANNL